MSTQELATPAGYWEGRARRYAGCGAGLAAVCSYGMPEFYNRAIDACQRLALAPWLDSVGPGTRVLDIGCGVGRWSRLLARRGAHVTGVDLSATMVAEAARRAALDGVGQRCRFLAQDLSALDAGGPYPFVLVVTVLQHILDAERLQAALARLAAHLAPGGRMVVLEAAPQQAVSRCDTAIFRARTANEYLRAFEDGGLVCKAVGGVDPMPLKTWYLPYYKRLPRPLAWAGLAGVTALSFPLDAMLGRRARERSWHKVFVLEHAARGVR